jgi:curved DNA-binding protein CbpA
VRDHEDEVSMGPREEPEDHSVVPQLCDDCDLGSLTLTPAEGYLLSRVDGLTPWGLLREVGGMPPEEVDACLRRFAEQGIVTLGGEKPEAHCEIMRAVEPSLPAPSGDASLLDPSLDLPLESQRSLLEFERGLDRPYHEILGVAPDAELRELRRAYFKLSKEFHPDRWFRKNLGPFTERVERVFRKIAEAFELLSDPSARQEMLRAMEAEGGGPAASGGAAPQLQGKRTPHAFSLLARIDRERRRKARQYHELGVAAVAEERWVEAARQLRLAIACDPANEDYKGDFAEANRNANEILFEKYAREADSHFQLGEYVEAYKRYEDALHRKPFDAEANHRAARLAWKVENDLKAAKEYAARACEVEGSTAAYRKTLGQVYAAAGLHKNAARELEEAARLDPRDEETKLELKTAKRMARRTPLGGS